MCKSLGLLFSTPYPNTHYPLPFTLYPLRTTPMLYHPRTSTSPALNNSFVAEWTTSADHEWIPPLHLHHECDEAWYVLEGRMVFVCGDEEIVAETGDFVLLPHGKPHSYRNDADGPSRYLIFMTAKTKALIEGLHSGSGVPMKEIFAAHDAELLG
jgi:mannose-6-phosphate isomerase-like protein (cupin superfamily)